MFDDGTILNYEDIKIISKMIDGPTDKRIMLDDKEYDLICAPFVESIKQIDDYSFVYILENGEKLYYSISNIPYFKRKKIINISFSNATIYINDKPIGVDTMYVEYQLLND